MNNLINLEDFELHFNDTQKAISDCFFSFTPTALRLKEELTSKISDIDLIKSISASYKHDLKLLMSEFHIEKDHLLFNINEYIFNLEVGLVNIAKYKDKIANMQSWFNSYHELKSYIITYGVQNIEPNVSKDSILSVSTDTSSTKKINNFSHLL